MTSNHTNRMMTLRAYPEGRMPEPGDFEVLSGPVPEPRDGEVLCKSIYLTVDPYIRARFSAFLAGGYADRTQLGEPIGGENIAQVVESNHPNFKPGDIVAGFGGWQDFYVMPGTELRPVNPSVAPITAGLGALGMPGLTGYSGLLLKGEPKEGETVLVSAATGGVGTVVGQIARIKGCRAVGISSGPDKCRYAVEELGYDVCLDRKQGDIAAQIADACPDGIDIDFENAGGPIFWGALENMNHNGRMVICGLIDSYNEDGPQPGKDTSMALLRMVALKALAIRGVMVSDHWDLYPQFQKDVGGWIKEGKFKHKEYIVDGMENAGIALIDMMNGANFGKTLVQVTDDPTV